MAELFLVKIAGWTQTLGHSKALILDINMALASLGTSPITTGQLNLKIPDFSRAISVRVGPKF